MRPQKDLYSGGQLFGLPTQKNILAIKERIVVKRKAGLIIIDGFSGEGKTTLGVEILEFYQGFKIDYETQYAMGGEQFKHKLNLCRKKGLSVILYDEAGDYSKRGALTTFNKDLNRTFQTFRTYQILVILQLPNFDILEQQIFLEGIPRLLLNCHGRTQEYGNIRGYGLKEMFWLKYNMSREVVKPLAYNKVIPNFRDHFKDLPKARSLELDRISTEGKAEILNNQTINRDEEYSIKQVEKLLNRSFSWIYDKMNEIGEVPRRSGIKNYISGKQLERLQEQQTFKKTNLDVV